MQIHHAAAAGELADQLVSLWSGTRSDPFAFDLAVVPSAGFQRWLSQRIASAQSTGGVCAGVEFVSPGQLNRRLGGADDPWRVDRLTRAVQQVVLAAECPASLSVLRRHLAASRETWSATGRIARHLTGYARHLPTMLAAWAQGRDVGPDGAPLGDHAWQAALYRLLVERLGCDPLSLRAALLKRLRESGSDELPARIAVVNPQRLDPASLELYEALGAQHSLDAFLLDLLPSPVATAHPLNLTLGSLARQTLSVAPAPTRSTGQRHPDTLLGWLQADLLGDRPPVRRVLAESDESVRVHLSHGPSRQVEVLREVLAGLFASDPTLEPRDVVVLTPDVDTFAPLLGAAFTPQPGGEAHPAHSFRLQVADRSIAQVNPLVELLVTLLELPDSRMEASALLELCASEPIAARFGFTGDAIDRLGDLVRASGVRWGLTAAQRAGFGLGDFRQNTWLAGLQRLLLGVTISEDDLVSVGTVLPLDDVDSSDVDVIGGLAELLARLQQWLTEISTPTTLAGWADRCRRALGQLIQLSEEDEWQLAVLATGLARLADEEEAATAPSAESQVQLSRHAAVRAITDELAAAPARGAFGNGSLVVAGLESLRSVPHRVVVLLGWDAERYPRGGHRHGDDLIGVAPPAWIGSPAQADRHALLEAIHAAGERLVVVAQGRSAATNQEVPAATPIAELIEALNATAARGDGVPAGAAVRVQHPLQPFAPSYFMPESGVRSYDPLALRAARARQSEPLPARDRFQLERLESPALSEGVELAALVDFYGHPVRALLSQRAGLRLGDDQPPSDAIPIEPDGLARWDIGRRVLRELQAGHAVPDVDRVERLRGLVPPAALGMAVMEQVLGEAGQTLAVAAPPGEVEHHDLSLTVPVPGHADVRLSGRVTTRGGVLWQSEFSRLQPRHRLAAWLRLLALATAGFDGSAHLVGKGSQARYLAPPAEAARTLLGRYLAIYCIGLTAPLPAPPRLTEYWVSRRASGNDPLDPRAKQRTERLWSWEADANWRTFFSYPEILELPVGEWEIPGADPAESSLLGALGSAIWTPVLAAEVAL